MSTHGVGFAPQPPRTSKEANLKDFLFLLGSWLYAAATSKVMLLAIGGALGTNARYWAAKGIGEATWAKGFPLGTFVINVTGSFLLGVAATIILTRLPPAHESWYLFFCTGFCGGYTTFSTFEWETFTLIRDNSLWLAFVNLAGSMAAGFVAVVAAVVLTTMLLPKQ